MRLALISDIHGNTAALDAVIADMNGLHPDVVICLGDIAAGGPDPGGAIDRVAEVATFAVQGNTDAGLVDMPAWWRDPGSIGLPDDAIPGMEVTVWTAERVTEEHRGFLADLPLTVEVDLGEVGDLLAFHGSPRSFDELVTATTAPDALDTMFAGTSASVMAGGHSHVPLLRRHRGITRVNPGSVGMPFGRYGYAGGAPVLAHAEYAVLSAAGSLVDVELRQVPVDRETLEASVGRSGMPRADWWLGLREGGDSV
ncbi:MAG: metallophosphatase family protein [Acidimicrobiia bacterium]|nr:metallophosphatase family protein [Acidimicrobiia bacterium]